MNDDRITELAHAVAAATAAGENEKLISILEPLSKEENEAVSALAAKVFKDNTFERLGELSVALAAAGNNSELVDAIIDSASFDERRYLVHVALGRAELLEVWIANRLDFVHVGGAGPFLFRTSDELRRVVELSTRVAFNDLLPTEQRLSAEDRDTIDDEIDELVTEAEQHAASRDVARGFKPWVLVTHWGLKLGRKTHAALVPSDWSSCDPVERYDTLCGQGVGRRLSFEPDNVSRVDCPGCLNALSLGGFLQPADAQEGGA